MQYKDYYQILGVERQASLDEIRQAYRRLAHKYHPDISQETGAEQQFKEVSEAYDVLSTPAKRSKYDRIVPPNRTSQGHTANKQTNTYTRRRDPIDIAYFEELSRQEHEKEKGFSDFFESLFGKRRKQNKSSDANSNHSDSAPPQNDGIPDTELVLDVEDLFHDTVKTLTTSSGNQVQVRIPRGASEGKKLRLPGQGLNGQALTLTIKVRPHPYYSIHGLDLYYELPITPWEAALGTDLTLPTPRGPVNLHIPPESCSGRKMRLAGRGLSNATENGDFYVVLLIQVPPAHSAEQKAFYTQMERLFPWTPRPHLKV